MDGAPLESSSGCDPASASDVAGKSNAIRDRLLVVDDDETSRDLFSRRLARHGYAVECACDGREALDKVPVGAYDLVLLDNMMPGMTGLTVLKHLRERLSVSELPVIMVTAQGESGVVAQALLLGANDFLVKPVEMSVAVDRIEKHLSRRPVAHRIRPGGAPLSFFGTHETGRGAWDWHLTTGRIHFSREWAAMLGYADDELRPDPEEWFRRVYPNDQTRLRNELDAHLASPDVSFSSEYRMRHRDGTVRHMRCYALTTRDITGIARRLTGAQICLSRSD